MKRKSVLILIALLTISEYTIAQGCSDAGVCTADNLHFNTTDSSRRKFRLNLAHTLGLGEQEVFNQATEVGLSIPLWKRSSLSLKFPYLVNTGNLGTITGLGDITFSFSQNLYSRNRRRINLLGGVKIPTNNSDLDKNGRDLPMPYQTSLGTYDLLFSTTYSSPKWLLTLGYQSPITENDNNFSHSLWQDDEDALEYFESANLSRGDDLVLRVQRKVKLLKSTLLVGLLPIYRLQQDVIILNSQEVELEGSKGLTLNSAITWEKKLHENIILRVNGGNPFIFRETRADGLTRSAVVTGSLTLKL
jgi:hypothetical protein